MPVSVVVGGQFGSEGKGKVAFHVARTRRAAAVARVGGPNSVTRLSMRTARSGLFGSHGCRAVEG